MSLRKNVVCLFGFCLALPLLSLAQAPSAATTPTAVTSREPDYPDRRGFTVGLHYWLVSPKHGIDSHTGGESPGPQELLGFGKYKSTPDVTISIPTTRTGMIYAEGFQIKGSGSQILTQDTSIFGDPYTKNTYIADSFKVTNIKVVYDDLLFPHKFPVARFRLKSLYGFNYTAIRQQVYDPVKVAAATGVASNDLPHLTLPTLGAAMEYAPTKHSLFRVDGQGFALPGHHSVMYEANAVLSIRTGKLEYVVGARDFHFKQNTAKQHYAIGTVIGAYAGLRWHF